MDYFYKNNNYQIYNCDNLELLKNLPNNYIDLIYCDILYNTGKNFRDYNDNLGTQQEAIRWYEPRLIEMKRVLKDIGTIYLHCDWHLVHYLKVKMDEIFGLKNFKNEIIWCYSGGGIPKKDLPRKHDNILRYVKSDNYIYNPEYKPYSEKTLQRGRTQCKGDIDLRKEGTPITDWWDDIQPLHSPTCFEKVGYDTQKPKELLQRIIKLSSNPEDTVADFFMGSGTTGQVAIELGRKFIGCDIQEKACMITKDRLTMSENNQIRVK